LSGINYYQANSAVLTDGSSIDLNNIKDDEALINDQYAKENNIKIGDTIQINDFVQADGSKTAFNQKYKIVGFAIKTFDMFSSNIFSSEPIPPYLYLTNKEIDRYVNYFYTTDN